LFTYASALWSQSPEFVNDDLNTNIDRFKYYFLIIPSIYLSNLSKKDINRLLLFVAIAPVLSIVIYYTNHLGLTSIFPFKTPDEDLILSHYLVQNFFILLSILYLYIHILSATKTRDYKKAAIYSLLLIVASISLVIHPDTTSRLMVLAFILIIAITPYFYLPKKVFFPLATLITVISISIVAVNPNFQRGIKSLEDAVTSERYVSSWGHRTAFALAGFEMFREHPLFGRGINDFSRPYEKIVEKNPDHFHNIRRFHNEHINILVATGIVGYALLVIFFISLYRLNIRDRDIHVFKNITVISIFFIMLGEHYLSVKDTTNFIAILITLFVLLRYRENEPEETGRYPSKDNAV
jgi:O-antigen ligase